MPSIAQMILQQLKSCKKNKTSMKKVKNKQINKHIQMERWTGRNAEKCKQEKSEITIKHLKKSKVRIRKITAHEITGVERYNSG